MMTTTTSTTTTPTSMLEELREGLAHLKDLETELSAAAKRDDDVESSSTTNSTLMMERYQQSRDLYLQRRMENLVVDHVATYDETTETFDYPPQASEEEDIELNERHTQALASLQTSAQRIQTQMSQLRDTKDAVASRRRELEQMMHDYLNNNNDDNNNNNNTDETTDDDAAAAPVADVDDDEMAMEQERIEQLQQTKRRLQDKLAKMQQETRQAQEGIRHNKEETALLQQQQQQQDEEDGDGEEDANVQDFSSKVEELREMKVFYDSLREVLEELGGVKILNVHEQASKDRHLLLTVLLYDEFQVQIELQVYRTTFLKLVHAKWISKPVVVVHPGADAADAAADAEQVVSPPQDGSSFSLTMESLDDLVQVAKTTLGPPHDVRFIIRETLARIRVHQARVDDLALLRRHVLTKVHHNNNSDSGNATTTQVVCSLNDGIVIVMRLYEQYVRVEQIVGVSGWTEATTDQIQAALQQQDKAETDTTTPTCSSIVRRVQAEIESFKKRGVADYPKGTPTMPKKQRKEGSNELD
jgi:myosin heavy subunit